MSLQYWNFSEALMQISQFKCENSKQSLFLHSLFLDLEQFEDIARGCYGLEYLLENQIVKIDDAFLQNIHNACELASQSAYKIIEKITLEKENFFLDEEQSSAKFSNFLKFISQCCYGVLLRAEGVNEMLVAPDYFDTILYSFCTNLGGIFVPAAQHFDPFRGKAVKNQEFIPTAAECFGYTERYVNAVRQGKNCQVSGLTVEAHQAQKEQFKVKDKEQLVFTSHNIKSVKWEIKKIVTNLNHTSIYKLGLSGPLDGQLTGHSQALRLTKDNGIEFFDPDYGLFFFKNQDDFIKWFSLLISVYKEKRNYFIHGIILMDCGKQQMEEPLLPSSSTATNSNFDFGNLFDYLNTFNRLSLEQEKIKYRDCSLKDLKLRFCENFASLIENVHDLNVLQETLDIMNNKECSSIQFILQRRHSFFDKLYSWFFQVEKPTQTQSEVIEIINQRMTQLQYKSSEESDSDDENSNFSLD